MHNTVDNLCILFVIALIQISCRQIESSEKVDIDLELDKLYRAICNDGVETPGTGRSTRIGQTSSIGPISQTEKYDWSLPLINLNLRLIIDCLFHGSVVSKDLSCYKIFSFHIASSAD